VGKKKDIDANGVPLDVGVNSSTPPSPKRDGKLLGKEGGRMGQVAFEIKSKGTLLRGSSERCARLPGRGKEEED